MTSRTSGSDHDLPLAEAAGLPPPAPRSTRKLILLGLGIVLAVVLLAVLGAGLDGPALHAAAARVPPGVWAAGVLGILVSYALRAARLHAEWRPRTQARYGDCLQLFVLHNAAVSLLPLRSGELGYAWWLLRRWQVPLTESLASLLWLRLQDAVVLALLALAGLSPLPGWWGPALAAAVALAAALLLPPLWRRWQAALPDPANDGAATPSGAGWRARVQQGLRKIAQALRSSRGGWRAWVFCVANWMLKLLVAALLLQAIGPLDLAAAWRGALGGEWAAVLPVQGPAGLGTYEAGVWAGALLGGAAGGGGSGAVTASSVVGAALIVHLLWLATSAASALLAWLWAARRSENPL
ncbi:lysylphosphatidylglycerol synthase-like protein [Sphaerotilus hippei]|uniref:Lysylphosphatidylglycerol synthase-like protein n=1 Tax=Sphaerotilus hippei TaxID=744406 RepID=A0A318H2L3_9BURK|nr:lysylphosphatidylglycerol synthase domain-containing protein [Sphaerotilus hippei]PXW95806.1 lysylphosphatidylglycerol synthase-like protein [Sphaerotilus hippei]